MAHHTFHITQEDIQQGRRENCTLCPVARAISRATGTTVAVGGINELSTGRIEYLTRDGQRVAHDLPQRVGEKILCYDKTGVMEPFLFALRVSGDTSHGTRARTQGERATCGALLCSSTFP